MNNNYEKYIENVYNIVKNAGRPVNSGFIELSLKLKEWLDLPEEDRFEYYSKIDTFTARDCLSELLYEGRLNNCDNHMVCLPEWNIPNQYNYSHADP